MYPETTHSWGCWSWGPDHYLCAVDHINKLRKDREFDMNSVDISTLAHRVGYKLGQPFEASQLFSFARAIEEKVREDCARIAEEYLDDPVLSGQGYATGLARVLRGHD